MARNTYSATFKAQVVLAVLSGEKELNMIASEYNLNPNMVRGWKKEFLDNASIVFEDKAKAEKIAKRKEVALEKKNVKMLKTIGQLMVERDFLQDCFRECGLPIPQFDTQEG